MDSKQAIWRSVIDQQLLCLFVINDGCCGSFHEPHWWSFATVDLVNIKNFESVAQVEVSAALVGRLQVAVLVNRTGQVRQWWTLVRGSSVAADLVT